MTWRIYHQHSDMTWHPLELDTRDWSAEKARAYADQRSREATAFRFREGGRFEAWLDVDDAPAFARSGTRLSRSARKSSDG